MTTKHDAGGPAFPATDANHEFAGMSLRDWFAGQAIPAIFADCIAARESNVGYANIAKRAYMVADAMLAERKNKRKNK